MFAVIDCGTTTSRIYIVNEEKQIVASGRKKVGVRNTSMTGSRDTLRNGVTELFFDILKENNIPADQVEFAIASGMITSEIGLKEIPHLVAPVGMQELVKGIVKVEDDAVLPIGRPIYFIPGIRNQQPEDIRAQDLRVVDFLRGEEVQCIGVLDSREMPLPGYIVALSSHTKIMYMNEQGQVGAVMSSISGQVYEAIKSATAIGKSIVPVEGEEPGGYTFEELMDLAVECVENAGLCRTMMMPRFLQILMKTSGEERDLFMDGAIAADDMKTFKELRQLGCVSNYYFLYGHEIRCKVYAYLLKKTFGDDVVVEYIHEHEDLDKLTVIGSTAVALEAIKADRAK